MTSSPVADPPSTPVPNSPPTSPPQLDSQTTPPPRSWRPLMLRLHFYAGVLIGPFLLIAAITGALYAAAPTIERVVYHDLLTVSVDGDRQPLSTQVAAAAAALPELSVTGVRPPAADTDSTRVYFDDPTVGAEKQRAVFVDPYTERVLGSEPVWFGYLPLSTWLDGLHRNLQLGEPGRVYSELAASWLWVVALGGLFLWIAKSRIDGRRGRRRRIFGVDRSVTGRARTLNWHGATGMWVLVVLLFLSATGITWSTYAGAHVTDMRAAMNWQRPQLDTGLVGPQQPAAGDHAGHATAGGGVAEATPDLDRVLEVATASGVGLPAEITLPSADGEAISVTEIDKPYRLTTDAVAIDPATMHPTSTVDYARDYSVMAKLADWGIRMHMGFLFGFLNQVLLFAVAIALITVIIRGYLMWWRRRPTRGTSLAVGRPPLRGGWRRVSPAALGAFVVAAGFIGWFLPLLGLSLIVFLALDAVIGAIGRRRRQPATAGD